MTQENKDRLLRLLQQHKALAISDQFIRSTSAEGGQKTTEVDRKGGQKTRDAILDMILRNAKVTSTQMAASLGINRSAVSKHLKKLQADGIIRRVGPDKGGHWEVT